MRNLLKFGWLVLLAMAVMHANPAQAVMTVDRLRCEYQDNPLAIDTLRPQLSWVLHSDQRDDVQTAYQIRVASSAEKLAQGEGDLWDNGKVASSESIKVFYHGQSLKRRMACHWQVRVWDRAGAASAWSQPARWEVGLMSPQDWQAAWLNDGKAVPQKEEDFYQEDPAPLFRKEFVLAKPIAWARLYASGLGYYEASLNGQRIGDQVLEPGWTRYSERVLYSCYDVTRQLGQRTNCLGVMLGNGWYNPLPLRMWGYLNLREYVPTGRPRFLARLEVEFKDGTQQTVVSDKSWKVGDGPIRFNNLYLGEIYDARKAAPGWDCPGFDDSHWRQPAEATEPIGPLRAQSQPPIRITRTLPTVNLTEPHPGVFIFDLSQNFAGWARLKLTAPANTRITLRYGELLNQDGTLNPLTSVCGQIKGKRKTADGKEQSVGGPGAPVVAWQADTYIANGKGLETYTPRFTFHGFRYVEVTGLPGRPSRDMITGLRLNSDVERVGSFSCSNDQFNRIQDLCDWTFLSNLFSVQSDCPHREKFGYGGDLAVTSEAFMMNYDMATFYAKSVRDLRDSALDQGIFPDTAPYVGLKYCGVAWALAHPLVQRQLYQYYGNRPLVEEQFEAAQRWLDSVATTNRDFIIQGGLSDHEGLEPAPAPAMVTPLFATGARIVSELAAILDRPEATAKYQRLAADIRQAYGEKFLEKTTGKVGPGTQTSQSLALYQRMVPETRQPTVLQFLLDDLRGPHTNHLSTGIYGTKYLLDVLSREGYADEACAIVNQKTFPGWGYMLANNATTLWEHWEGSDNTYSHNHPMFGSVSQWFYQWLGGIQPAPDAVGFDRILIRPQAVKGLTWVRSSYQSIRGKIVSDWQREGNELNLQIEIPVNATAWVYLPADAPEQITESGKPASQFEKVHFERAERHQVIYRVGSGRYAFKVLSDK